MKGVESLRIQSFKGFWKSQKILGLDFWESPGRDFEKNPGIPGYPGIPQQPDDEWRSKSSEGDGVFYKEMKWGAIPPNQVPRSTCFLKKKNQANESENLAQSFLTRCPDPLTFRRRKKQASESENLRTRLNDSSPGANSHKTICAKPLKFLFTYHL